MSDPALGLTMLCLVVVVILMGFPTAFTLMGLGMGFGFVLVAARLNQFDTIHRMLLLQELDVYFLMGSAIATAAPLLWWLRRSHWRTLNGELKVAQEKLERAGISINELKSALGL